MRKRRQGMVRAVTVADISSRDRRRVAVSEDRGGAGAFIARLTASDNSALRALFVYALRIGGAGLIFVAQVVIARWLTPAEYGVFANVWVGFILVGGFASLGLGGAMIRFVPEYRARGQAALLRGLRRTGRVLGTGFSLIAALGGYAALRAADGLIDPVYHGPIILALCALPFYAVSDVNDGLCRGYGRPLRGIAPNYLLRPVLMIVGVLIAALAFGAVPSAYNAMLVVAIAFSLTVVVQTWITEAGISDGPAAPTAGFDVKTWLAVAMPLVLMEGMLSLMGHVDVLAVGALRGPEDVALYYAATRIVALVAFVPYAVIAIIGPRFSHCNALDDEAGLRTAADQALTLSLWPSLILSVGIIAAGPWLLYAFGAEFVAAYDVLVVLLVSVVLRAAVAPAQTMLAMTGHHAICVAILSAALTANVILNVDSDPDDGAGRRRHCHVDRGGVRDSVVRRRHQAPFRFRAAAAI